MTENNRNLPFIQKMMIVCYLRYLNFEVSLICFFPHIDLLWLTFIKAVQMIGFAC